MPQRAKKRLQKSKENPPEPKFGKKELEVPNKDKKLLEDLKKSQGSTKVRKNGINPKKFQNTPGNEV